MHTQNIYIDRNPFIEVKAWKSVNWYLMIWHKDKIWLLLWFTLYCYMLDVLLFNIITCCVPSEINWASWVEQRAACHSQVLFSDSCSFYCQFSALNDEKMDNFTLCGSECIFSECCFTLWFCKKYTQKFNFGSPQDQEIRFKTFGFYDLHKSTISFFSWGFCQRRNKHNGP